MLKLRHRREVHPRVDLTRRLRRVQQTCVLLHDAVKRHATQLGEWRSLDGRFYKGWLLTSSLSVDVLFIGFQKPADPAALLLPRWLEVSLDCWH